MQTIDLHYPDTDTFSADPVPRVPGARALYFALLDADGDGPASGTAHSRETGDTFDTPSIAFLEQGLRASRQLPCDLPERLSGLEAWMAQHTDGVLADYQHYLAQRKAGAPRQYFATRSHALHFLTAVAPTKTVDGSWLYGLLSHWQDDRFATLIRIYLDELGGGVPEQNHVLLYKRLLLANGCERWEHLDDHHFMQGALQLALAHNAERFLPELIGFNLGYEQLPLHLLITAYELNELGIDPTYFGLHVTVDNADTGHARQALQGLRDSLPVLGDRQAFYRRVVDGYRLNDLGAGTNSVIAGFNLEAELIEVLTRKSAAGKQAHADYCRIGGRTVNDWLSEPANLPGFVEALQRSGWIKRGEPAQNSRFWKLIDGERADMFGIFSAYEQQVLRDWIESGAPALASATSTAAAAAPAAPARTLSFKARQKLLENLERKRPAGGPAASDGRQAVAAQGERRAMPRQLSNQGDHHSDPGDAGDAGDDFNAELRELTVRLAHATSKSQAMQFLASLMAPSRHHTHVGLHATRIFARMFGASR